MSELRCLASNAHLIESALGIINKWIQLGCTICMIIIRREADLSYNIVFFEFLRKSLFDSIMYRDFRLLCLGFESNTKLSGNVSYMVFMCGIRVLVFGQEVTKGYIIGISEFRNLEVYFVDKIENSLWYKEQKESSRFSSMRLNIVKRSYLVFNVHKLVM